MPLPAGASIRPAREADAAAIKGMVREARLDPTQLVWSQFLVVEREGKLLGVGQLRRYGPAQELGSLVVAKPWRSYNIGGALIEALIARRDSPLFLECRAPLAAYYEWFGFQRVPWHAVPWPMRAKFGLSHFASRLFRSPVVAMRYDEAASQA